MARETVWQSLSELGGLRPGLPARDGGGVGDQVILAQKIGAALYQSPWADTVTAIEIATALGRDDRLVALEALSTAADLARSLGTEAVQLHGAVGMTEEHDAQLFYRRIAVDALLLGRPTELRRQAAALLSEKHRPG